MIRNNDEYMMPDGSPRFGVRVGEGLADTTEPTEATAPVTAGDLAHRAEDFTAHQLSVAGKLRFTARNNAGAEKALRDLRVSHPAEYGEAVAAVNEHLGSPKEWRQDASEASRMAVLESEKERGVVAGTINGMLLRLALAVLPIVAVIGLLAAGIDQWIAFSVSFAVSLAIGPIQGYVKRRTIGADGAEVSAATVGVLWDDVVDATFVNILEAKGIPVDAYTHKAATAGWIHLARTADAVEKLVSGAV